MQISFIKTEHEKQIKSREANFEEQIKNIEAKHTEEIKVLEAKHLEEIKSQEARHEVILLDIRNELEANRIAHERKEKRWTKMEAFSDKRAKASVEIQIAEKDALI